MFPVEKLHGIANKTSLISLPQSAIYLNVNEGFYPFFFYHFFLSSTQIFTALRCKPYSCTVALFARTRSSLGWLTHGTCISRSMHASAWWKYCFMRFLLIFTNLWSFSAEDTCRHCKVWFAVNSHFCAAFGSVVVPQHSGSLVCRQATRQPPAVTGDASVQQGALKLELNLSSFEQKQQQRTRVFLSARISRARQMLLKFTRVSFETSASVCLDVKPFCVGEGTKQCDAAAVCLTSSWQEQTDGTR